VAVAAFYSRRVWSLLVALTAGFGGACGAADQVEGTAIVLSPQARSNLGLTVKKLMPTTYWRVIELPGVVVDRPGVSDRGVTTPIAGTIVAVHAFPGTTVPPLAPLFTIRLVSDSVHKSQLELFKATREIQIAERQRKRLEELAQSGALAQTRIFDIENQLDRMQATVEAYRQDLAARGLSIESIDAAAAGQFVTEIIVRSPAEAVFAATPGATDTALAAAQTEKQAFAFEVHSLDVELGQHVEAGTVLMHLADHRCLVVEGRGFKDDMPLVQNAARQALGIELDTDEPEGTNWPAFHEKLPIDHISNTVDPVTRTFSFFINLENQWQTYRQASGIKTDDLRASTNETTPSDAADNPVSSAATRVLWRFRPGSRVRLRVAAQRLDNVFVVPREAVVFDGPRAFVFRQTSAFVYRNAAALFERIEVSVVHEDRLNFVLSHNESLTLGGPFAQSAAASLERIRKSDRNQGVSAGTHVHADGTLHEAHK